MIRFYTLLACISHRRLLCAVVWSGLGVASSGAGPVTSAPAGGGPVADRPPLAVLDFSVGEDIKPAHGQMLAAVVREEFQKADRFDLIDREMMRQRMTEKDFASTTECNQVRCLVKYGRSLEVQKIVGGFTTSFGKTWTLTIRLVDVNTGREEETFTRENFATMEALLPAARQGARVLLGLEKEVPPEPAPQPRKPDDPEQLVLDLGGGVKMELVLIPAGEFMMGSPDSQPGRDSDEGPQHRVRISRPFSLGKYEVTQAQWQAVMGNNPSSFKGDNLPVETVSWDDCQAFCQKLSAKTGVAVRLATESEWEYACRAGSTGRFCFGDSDEQLREHAWYGGNSGSTTHPVGGKKPNAWGLYDMHGNVWEWCEDVYHGTYAGAPDDGGSWTLGAEEKARVLRGGLWLNSAANCRSAVRYRNRPDGRLGNNGGFRVVAGT